MDLELLIAQWSGQLPPGFLLPAERPEARPKCSHKRCHRPVTIKRNGEQAKACQRCLDRRARSCRRRRAFFVARGGWRRCAYRRVHDKSLVSER